MDGIIWCPPASSAAMALSRQLGWRKMRTERGMRRFLRRNPPPSAVVVLSPHEWTSSRQILLQSTSGKLVLVNDKVCWNKLNQHHVLKGAGIPTLDVLSYPPDEGWIPRTMHHGGGDDFLQPIEPDYFTRKVSVEKEFRFHIIGGKSVKAGGKIPLPEAHEWVRARQFGWVVDYGPRGREGITKEMRDMAKEAALTLQMDAGVVDVWKLTTGEVLVGEVNMRPGMDAPTVWAWAEALKEFCGNTQ